MRTKRLHKILGDRLQICSESSNIMVYNEIIRVKETMPIPRHVNRQNTMVFWPVFCRSQLCRQSITY